MPADQLPGDGSAPIGQASPQPPASPPAPQPGGSSACPASFQEAMRLQVDCDQTTIDFCAYPEGTCSCDAPRQCGGMRRKVIIDWSCEGKPPAVRSDGCPGELPKAGEACVPEGKRCRYHKCDPSAECSGGRWQIKPPKRRS